ncbi:MAG: ATP-dependent RecD-like DNA helicase [Clostridiales bacterium]|nr:ATP-dependent RecD-like DNA helicase [Clostridiales bacterium]
MRINGVVEEIIYKNDDNHYTVAVMAYNHSYITIVGYGYGIKKGDEVELDGEFVFHDAYGEQFKFTTAVMTMPNNEESILKFLTSGNIKGIGPSIAEKIIDKFGEETLDIINFNPDKLLKVNGIGKSKLKQIVESYSQVVGNRDTIMFLQSLEIGAGLINRIIKIYGARSREIITKNPYRLYDDIDGIGFVKADAIASKMGVEKASKYRIRSFIKHYLYESANNGNAYIYFNDLLMYISNLLDLDKELIQTQIEELIIKGDLIQEIGEKAKIYLNSIYNSEVQVAAKLIAINSFSAFKDINETQIIKIVNDFQANESIYLNDAQINAIKSSLSKKITVITGGPGTGKTTIIKAIVDICKYFDLKVHLTAPTGRAAKRMEESTASEAKTIHRLLEYQYIEDLDVLTFNKNEEDPLKSDIIIIDEASMIDINLFNYFLKAVTVETKLVIIGDADQLPSIGPGNVLQDIIDSYFFTTIRLNEIYRQGENSLIVLNAHLINHGNMPKVNEKEGDFFVMQYNKQNEILENLKSLISERLPKFYNLDPVKDIQIITPLKNGVLGTRNLNELMQNTLNPQDDEKPEIQFQSKKFRLGDKVMQFKNNYNIQWIDRNSHQRGEGVFNGEIGFIESIDVVRKSMKVVFDENKEVDFEYKDLNDIELSYSITIHKSQGSEFKTVIIPISYIPPKMASKNLLYTAVTRGKNLVIIIGDRKYLQLMIQSDEKKERNSGLIDQLKKFEKPYGEDINI